MGTVHGAGRDPGRPGKLTCLRGYVRLTEGLEHQPKGSELVPSKPHRALEGS